MSWLKPLPLELLLDHFSKQLYYFSFLPTVYNVSNSLHPANSCYYLTYSYLKWVWSGNLIVVLISWWLNNVDHLFMGLLAICMSLGKFLFKLFVFLLLGCKSSFCILDIRPLSDTWYANIFFHSVSCLFTFLIMSF